MSILEKCEKIGIELRRTKEGRLTTEHLNKVNENPQELTVELFKLINHHYVKIHFFSVSHAIDVLKGNTENRILGELVKRILGIDGLEQFGKANIPIGKFVDKLSIMSFNNSVKYQLPTEITATPELIRLSNSLTVECQRLNLVQKFLREYFTDPRFSEAVKRFDELKGMEPILPYSKEDRKVLKALKNEYLETKIDLIYSFVSTLTYIKCMIFDSFYDNIFEVYETKDVLTLKEKTLNGCRFVQIVMNPNDKTFGANTGWILKLHSTDNTIVYGQIFSKQMKFSQNKCIITVKALVHDIL